MTIIEAINKIDSLKPNSYSQEDKIAWLNALDSDIKKNVIDTHRCEHEITFDGYDENTPLDTDLLAPAPYDEMYLHWLEAKIDYSNGEYSKYNNSVITYNTDYEAFVNYYNRNNMPLCAGRRFKF